MNLSRVSHYFLRIREKTLSQVSSSIGCLVVLMVVYFVPCLHCHFKKSLALMALSLYESNNIDHILKVEAPGP